MNYTIAGSGNMAWFLGTKLQAAGHTCSGVFSHNTEHAAVLAGQLHAPVFHSAAQLIQNTTVCIIAIADKAIAGLAAQLQTETVLIHTSGTTPVHILENASPNAAVLWPIYSILKNDLPQHRNVPCAWEATSMIAAKTVQEIAASFTGILFESGTEQRQWLHLTAVMCNNFINHIAATGNDICTEQQVQFSVLSPILQQTFDKLQHHAAKDIQTGPARRGDTQTIEKHLSLLTPFPFRQDMYRAITASIQNMYGLKSSKKDLND
ncbi:DUF2520 domain-containing protein [Chitinophagaceae bacterium MMS25-I14]